MSSRRLTAELLVVGSLMFVLFAVILSNKSVTGQTKEVPELPTWEVNNVSWPTQDALYDRRFANAAEAISKDVPRLIASVDKMTEATHRAAVAIEDLVFIALLGKDQAPDFPIDINTASFNELIRVPGVGVTVAAQIMLGRPYAAVDGLAGVPAIGGALREQVSPFFKFSDPVEPDPTLPQ